MAYREASPVQQRNMRQGYEIAARRMSEVVGRNVMDLNQRGQVSDTVRQALSDALHDFPSNLRDMEPNEIAEQLLRSALNIVAEYRNIAERGGRRDLHPFVRQIPIHVFDTAERLLQIPGREDSIERRSNNSRGDIESAQDMALNAAAVLSTRYVIDQPELQEEVFRAMYVAISMATMEARRNLRNNRRDPQDLRRDILLGARDIIYSVGVGTIPINREGPALGFRGIDQRAYGIAHQLIENALTRRGGVTILDR